MIEPDPYAAPHSENEPAGPRPRSDLVWVRAVLYFHLITILLCAALSLTETGRLPLPELIRLLVFTFATPIALTGMICPVVMGIAASGLTQRSLAFRLGTVIGDNNQTWIERCSAQR